MLMKTQLLKPLQTLWLRLPRERLRSLYFHKCPLLPRLCCAACLGAPLSRLKTHQEKCSREIVSMAATNATKSFFPLLGKPGP